MDLSWSTLPKARILALLGPAANTVDRIGLAEVVDRKVGPRPGEKVSTGIALEGAVLNTLGFGLSPPTSWVLGPGVTPEPKPWKFAPSSDSPYPPF